MIAATHPVAPEDVMALLDGELSSAEAQTVSTHLDHCAKCTELAGQLRSTSQSLAAWTVSPVPLKVDDAVKEMAENASSKRKKAKRETYTRISFWNWRLWAIGGTGAVAVLVLLAIFSISYFSGSGRPSRDGSRVTEQIEQLAAAPDAPPRPGGAAMVAPDALSAPGVAADSKGLFHGLGDHSASSFSAGAAAIPASAPAPMIARSIALTIQVRDFAASRAALDAILARHHGYAATLTVNTPENDSRSFQASLRIPAPELAAALVDIRTLGRVEVETQSGEEVTQQHADLVARLENARETEQRLRELLVQRTGKIDEVLQVEEAIDRVRGEIESMEAEQKTLEHRVDFATVDLQLTEEYREKFNPEPASVSGTMHNAFVTGLRHAAGTLLGIVLFLEEFGPVLLIWVVILGLPAILGWRRYRRARDRF
jgi:anti-sigma factor RsiW